MLKRIQRKLRQVRKENYKEFYKGELPRRYIAKVLYGQDNKRFDQEY